MREDPVHADGGGHEGPPIGAREGGMPHPTFGPAHAAMRGKALRAMASCLRLLSENPTHNRNDGADGCRVIRSEMAASVDDPSPRRCSELLSIQTRLTERMDKTATWIVGAQFVDKSAHLEMKRKNATERLDRAIEECREAMDLILDGGWMGDGPDKAHGGGSVREAVMESIGRFRHRVGGACARAAAALEDDGEDWAVPFWNLSMDMALIGDGDRPAGAEKPHGPTSWSEALGPHQEIVSQIESAFKAATIDIDGTDLLVGGGAAGARRASNRSSHARIRLKAVLEREKAEFEAAKARLAADTRGILLGVAGRAEGPAPEDQSGSGADTETGNQTDTGDGDEA